MVTTATIDSYRRARICESIPIDSDSTTSTAMPTASVSSSSRNKPRPRDPPQSFHMPRGMLTSPSACLSASYRSSSHELYSRAYIADERPCIFYIGTTNLCFAFMLVQV